MSSPIDPETARRTFQALLAEAARIEAFQLDQAHDRLARRFHTTVVLDAIQLLNRHNLQFAEARIGDIRCPFSDIALRPRLAVYGPRAEIAFGAYRQTFQIMNLTGDFTEVHRMLDTVINAWPTTPIYTHTGRRVR